MGSFLTSPSFPVPSSFVRLWAVSTHVTLVPASVAVPFVPPFLSFGVVQATPSLAPVCTIRAFADCGRIDVHRVRIPSGLLTRWSSKWFAASILAHAEEVTASRSEAGHHHASMFDFASRGCLSVVKALWNRISLEDGVMDSLSNSLLKHLQGSFCTMRCSKAAIHSFISSLFISSFVKSLCSCLLLTDDD